MLAPPWREFFVRTPHFLVVAVGWSKEEWAIVVLMFLVDENMQAQLSYCLKYSLIVILHDNFFQVDKYML